MIYTEDHALESLAETQMKGRMYLLTLWKGQQKLG